jgi:hypothetical protein
MKILQKLEWLSVVMISVGSKGAYIEGKVIRQRVKSSQFNGRYHIDDAYTIIVEKDGAEFGREGDEEAYIPFETSMDYDGRVELIDTCDNDAEI